MVIFGSLSLGVLFGYMIAVLSILSARAQNKNLQNKIKKLTDEEDQTKPLSDSKIAAILLERDVKIARRTIAKYRESLGIPSSSERKKYLK